MGKSITINCIGQCTNGNLEYAMTKLEVYQKTILYPEIEYWYTQTKKGDKILGGSLVYRGYILDNPPKGLIDCVCKTSCHICKGSKKITKRELKSYRKWQIEECKNK